MSQGFPSERCIRKKLNCHGRSTILEKSELIPDRERFRILYFATRCYMCSLRESVVSVGQKPPFRARQKSPIMVNLKKPTNSQGNSVGRHT